MLIGLAAMTAHTASAQFGCFGDVEDFEATGRIAGNGRPAPAAGWWTCDVGVRHLELLAPASVQLGWSAAADGGVVLLRRTLRYAHRHEAVRAGLQHGGHARGARRVRRATSTSTSGYGSQIDLDYTRRRWRQLGRDRGELGHVRHRRRTRAIDLPAAALGETDVELRWCNVQPTRTRTTTPTSTTSRWSARWTRRRSTPSR